MSRLRLGRLPTPPARAPSAHLRRMQGRRTTRSWLPRVAAPKLECGISLHHRVGMFGVPSPYSAPFSARSPQLSRSIISLANQTYAHQPQDRSVLIEQPLDLARHPLLVERLTNRVVDAAKTAECLTVAKQVHDTRMLL
jgi:hypothetical protein